MKGAAFSRIVGSGSALPERCVSNAELVAQLAQRGVETSDQWIVERTGIRQRYVASAELTSSQLGYTAAVRALEVAGIAASEIDLIICATSTPDFVFPSTACLIQEKLGCRGAAAFDVQAVCSGFTYALATADAYIKTGLATKALVIGAEVFSRILDWNDRGTCVLFGDGAGAVVLTGSDSAGVLAARLHADGSQQNILRTAGNISSGAVIGHPFLTMDGPAVFKLAVKVLDEVAREVLELAGKTPADVDWLIPHQANMRILSATAKKLGIAESKTIMTVDRHANTSAASIPLALDDAWRSGRIKPGQLLLLEGVGGGFTWGAVLVQI